MKKITMYKAIDGKVFDTQQECEEYEKKIPLLKKYANQIFLYDYSGVKLDYSEEAYTEMCVWVKITTTEAALAFDTFWRERDLIPPWGERKNAKAGLWYFNDTDEVEGQEWLDITFLFNH